MENDFENENGNGNEAKAHHEKLLGVLNSYLDEKNPFPVNSVKDEYELMIKYGLQSVEQALLDKGKLKIDRLIVEDMYGNEYVLFFDISTCYENDPIADQMLKESLGYEDEEFDDLFEPPLPPEPKIGTGVYIIGLGVIIAVSYFFL